MKKQALSLASVVLLAANLHAASSTVSSSDFDALDERVEELETKVLMDKLAFSTEFKTRMDNYAHTMGDDSKWSDNNLWSTQMGLNFRADVDESMKVTGKLSMRKYWGDSDSNGQGAMDPKQGRAPADSTLYVERIYVDWTALGGSAPLTFTLGRQPSSDGPSHHFKDDTVRKSTYNALVVDGASDGIVATWNLANVTHIPQTAIRLGYGKGYTEHETATNVQNPYVGVDGAVDDSTITGVFFDTSIPGVKGSWLQFAYVKGGDMIANPMDANGSANMNIGDLTLMSVSAEFADVAATGLDVFAHYAASTASPETNGAGYSLISDGTGSDDQTGNAVWAGVRYTLPVSSRPKIGFEYNKGSENWASLTWGPSDMTNKLSTRGVATEVYYIQPLNRFAHIRLGVVQIDYEYTGSGTVVGAPMKVSDAGAMATDKLTNAYAEFSLRF